MSSVIPASACGFSLSGGRARNEDLFLILDESHEVVRRRRAGSLFAVADGMGGHAGGEVASRIAVDTLVEFFDTARGRNRIDPLDRLEELVREANRRILARGEEDPGMEGLGTTLTVAHLRGATVHFVHAGDSRLLRVREGRVEVLTEDHNVAHRLYLDGSLDSEGVASSPYRGSLLNFLGKPSLTVQKGASELRVGDRFVLATDGLGAALPETELAEICSSEGDAEDLCEVLCSRVAARRPADNATAVVVCIDQVAKSHA